MYQLIGKIFEDEKEEAQDNYIGFLLSNRYKLIVDGERTKEPEGVMVESDGLHDVYTKDFNTFFVYGMYD